METATTVDEIRQHVDSSIAENGYAVLSVDVPDLQLGRLTYAYTVGLSLHKLPELVITGILPADAMGAILARQASYLLQERVVQYGVRRDDVVNSSDPEKKLDSVMVRVNAAEAVRKNGEWLLQWVNLNPHLDIEVAQVLWPDTNNVFPDAVGYDERYVQPLITRANGSKYDDILPSQTTEREVMDWAERVESYLPTLVETYRKAGTQFDQYQSILGLFELLRGAEGEFESNLRQALSFALEQHNLKNLDNQFVVNNGLWQGGALYVGLVRRSKLLEPVEHLEEAAEEVTVELQAASEIDPTGVWIRTNVYSPANEHILRLTPLAWIEQQTGTYVLCQNDGAIQLLTYNWETPEIPKFAQNMLDEALKQYVHLFDDPELLYLAAVNLEVRPIEHGVALYARQANVEDSWAHLLSVTFNEAQVPTITTVGALEGTELEESTRSLLTDYLWTLFENPQATEIVSNPNNLAEGL